MSKSYIDVFEVTQIIDGKYVCTSQNNAENETLVPCGFLFAHSVGMEQRFMAEVDYGGQIMLETIVKI